MNEIVFATHNRNKALEIQEILGQDFRVLTLDQAGLREDIPEERDSLEGNAFQKAMYVYERLGRDCFADDTGLEVKSLYGEPGVFSARYAELSGERLPGESIPDANIRKLLRKMEGVGDRTARFRTVIALVMVKQQLSFEGIVEGRIIEEKRGEGGFGYDPVFIPKGYRKTFAEMSLTKKNKISHRARAVIKLREFLKGYSGD